MADEYGLKRSSGVDYSQVQDRQIDDNRFERQRAIRAASAAVRKSLATRYQVEVSNPVSLAAFIVLQPPAEKSKHAAAQVAAPQSATMEPSCFKKENADKLDLNGNGEKEMKEYRKKLDAAREKKLAGSSGSKKRKKKHKKRSHSSSSDDSSSEDERRRSRHKSRKKNDSDSDDDRSRRRKRSKKSKKSSSRRKDRDASPSPHKVQQQQQTKAVALSDSAGKEEALQVETSDEVRRASLPECGNDVAGMAAWQTLVWRDAFSMAPYFQEAVNGSPAHQASAAGRAQWLRHGLTVWPAACVLLKHLEHRAAKNSKALVDSDNPFVLELGSGTGAVGIAAAMLLRAGRVVLTDMGNVRFIMQENADLARQDGVIDKHVVVDVEAYEWGLPPSKSLISPPEKSYPDLILVSDCILPRLYPIEPLVEALTLLSGPHTRILISYEHRHYQHFQPKQRFWELMEDRKFSLRVIDSNEYHPHFVASDIEVWEITADSCNII
ncbi:S-adenosyl-L-methionine-dependent methyltransferase [Phytophthora cactorum]|nr:S-adenosyl-L-methionine-dependent methyltransferase [Phytophthora cactorum]